MGRRNLGPPRPRLADLDGIGSERELGHCDGLIDDADDGDLLEDLLDGDVVTVAPPGEPWLDAESEAALWWSIYTRLNKRRTFN